MSGLQDVSTIQLESLLRKIDHDDVIVPLTASGLSHAGLNGLQTGLDLLGPLDAQGVRAVVVAILAERSQKQVELELVWTGPNPDGSVVRDTSVTLKHLFQNAKNNVLVAGFAFSHAKAIFAPLHEVMVGNDVTVSMYIDVGRVREKSKVSTSDGIREAFLKECWPFAEPYPKIYADERGLNGDIYSSQHAKCVIVDDERVLIGSANFTGRGQERNVEVGVLIHDVAFAKRLSEQWRRAKQQGFFVEI